MAFGRGTNLHALWDSGSIDSMGLNAAELASKLTAGRAGDVSLDMARAAGESCKFVGTGEFYQAVGSRIGMKPATPW